VKGFERFEVRGRVDNPLLSAFRKGNSTRELQAHEKGK
jgi:hypothetical protein